MSETIWLGDLLLWAAFGLVLMVACAWLFFSMAELDEWTDLLRRWLLFLGLAAFWAALMLTPWVPGSMWPVFWIVVPAGLLGAGIGAICGLIWYR